MRQPPPAPFRQSFNALGETADPVSCIGLPFSTMHVRARGQRYLQIEKKMTTGFLSSRKRVRSEALEPIIRSFLCSNLRQPPLLTLAATHKPQPTIALTGWCNQRESAMKATAMLKEWGQSWPISLTGISSSALTRS
jgi:hypothetical protein